MRNFASPHADRESLLHAGQDSMADWGLEQTRAQALNSREGLHEVCCTGNCNQGRNCPMRWAGEACAEPEDDATSGTADYEFIARLSVVLAFVSLGLLAMVGAGALYQHLWG